MTDARVESAFRVCGEMTRTQARNFYYGLRLLPPPTREALYAVYAWMRVADDIADEGGAAVEDRRARLDQLAADTRVALTGEMRSEHAVLVALAAISRRYVLPAHDFDAAIEGQRMDLEPRVYASFAETALYCDRVASTVGRICLAIWGVREGVELAAARELSTQRGIAFQLTNILRDVREDHARGRCYLPADELAAHGLDVSMLVSWRDATRCERFMQMQCLRAKQWFDQSAPLDALVAQDAEATIRAMSAIYRGILRVIARDPAGAMRTRARLSSVTKLMIALRARLRLLPAGDAS